MANASNFAGISVGSNPPFENDINPNATCDKWSRNNKYFSTCNVSVATNGKQQTVVEGIIKNPLRGQLLNMRKQIYVQYWAPSPPDHRESFSGSELPFPNQEIAFENSPNIGRVKLGNDGSFRIHLLYPNSYYKTMGADYIKPHVKLLFCDQNGDMYGKIITIALDK